MAAMNTCNYGRAKSFPAHRYEAATWQLHGRLRSNNKGFSLPLPPRIHRRESQAPEEQVCDSSDPLPEVTEQ